MAPPSPTRTRLLEINLISAQGLKPPPSRKLRRIMHTYALVYINPSTKVRTRIDKLGGENPTWNDRFFFKVTPEFLSGDTSAVTVEIYAVGYLKDPLIGTVRTYLSSILPPSISSNPNSNPQVLMTPSFTAVQIRRPSGRFYGVLNLGATVVFGSDFGGALSRVSAMDYHDLMGERNQNQNRNLGSVRRSQNLNQQNRLQRTGSEESYTTGSSWCGSGSMEFSDLEFEDDYDDDGAGSTTSASSAASTTTTRVLKDFNGVRELAGKVGMMRSSCIGGAGGGFMMCGLLTSAVHQKKIHLSPSDANMVEAHDENHI